MTISEICKVIDEKERYLSEEGRAALVRIDELAEELVSKLGADTAQEIINLIGHGWEYEFFSLIEEYVQKRGVDNDI